MQPGGQCLVFQKWNTDIRYLLNTASLTSLRTRTPQLPSSPPSSTLSNMHNARWRRWRRSLEATSAAHRATVTAHASVTLHAGPTTVVCPLPDLALAINLGFYVPCKTECTRPVPFMKADLRHKRQAPHIPARAHTNSAVSMCACAGADRFEYLARTLRQYQRET